MGPHTACRISCSRP